MKKLALAALLVLATTSLASAQLTLTNPDGSFYAGHNNGLDARVLAQNAISYNGQPANEYIIDIFASYYKGRDYLEVYDSRLVGLDPTQVLNTYGGEMRDIWSGLNSTTEQRWAYWDNDAWAWIPYESTFVENGGETNVQPAYGDPYTDSWVIDPSEAEQTANGWQYDAAYSGTNGAYNTWHAPSDYTDGSSVAVYGTGYVADIGTMSGGVFTGGTDGVNDAFHFPYWGGYPGLLTWNDVTNPAPVLSMTLRIVTTEDLSDEIANGGLGWVYDDGWGGNRVSVLEMYDPFGLNGRVGDFDGDGDIDADDIDALGAAIQAGSVDLAFDMDGNGLVEQADFNLHVTTLVDTLIGEGSGTMFGDFNLDGVIDLIDLGTLGEQYGIGTGWATGDTDGNGVIDLIDLGSVGENYGFAATAPIPEPATMTLLGLGAVALIRRRRNT